MEHRRARRARSWTRTRTARTRPAPSSTASRAFEAGSFPDTDTIHFPKSCLHCEEPPCVPVCPTGASYKRKEDGIVLVDYDKCIGCKYCAWACPYGAREIDEARQVMTKCTLCVDRIYDESLRAARPPAGLRQGVPDRRAPVRRRQGSRLGGVARDPRARRLFADAGVGHQAGQPVPAAARHRRRRRADARRRDLGEPRRAAMNPAFSVDRLHDRGRRRARPRRRARARRCSAALATAPASRRACSCSPRRCSLIGLGASFLHLGRPERAWRAAAMWRSSWLSREVIVLPAFIGVVVSLVAGASPRLAAAVDARRAAARRHRASRRCSGSARR